ncbi:TetR/AcrR family transcriptional regulator [Thalassomonas viridans]|uniref:TetR/AcrR family transcriptional regulator n=1 Tax=Thalassomonas viridans TaxID=137584 RepID=A0AAE9YXU6_9GAMM|nr:TetR/AcrR family transcriptional regulator [Thalassomonas viridans]WDE03221.1 TetR/AcrR family transcriptional regulator [Thalassomonas viridans]
MSKKATREHIVEAADNLFYQQGFEHTSFAHIAKAVNISRGNFYYHFKSKDEILSAVIQHRLTNTREMLEQWQREGGTPAGRIRCFINILITNLDKIKRYGCPVGSLTTELSKLSHTGQGEANQLFSLFRTWLRRQFEQLGHRADADELAMHLLARSQGVATLASAFNDETFIKQEVERLYQWLSAYSNVPPEQ